MAEKVNYDNYLKISELLSLQDSLSEPKAHDELLFITIHQAYELWFKQILFEMDAAGVAIENDDPYEATRILQRVLKIESILVPQIHILETMTPRDFMSFRKILNPASGFQSVQFREVEFLSGMKSEAVLKSMDRYELDTTRLHRRYNEASIRELFYEAMQRAGYDICVPPDNANPLGEDLDRTLNSLKSLYEFPERHYKWYLLSEALVSHDQNLLLWRFHHVRVVERLIGSKMGTGGSAGVKYLESTLSKRAFPMLWFARGMLTDDLYGTIRGHTVD